MDGHALYYPEYSPERIERFFHARLAIGRNSTHPDASNNDVFRKAVETETKESSRSTTSKNQEARALSVGTDRMPRGVAY